MSGIDRKTATWILHTLATADAIISATARARRATLLTCDAHSAGLSGITLSEKING